jgi:hypothetical protein
MNAINNLNRHAAVLVELAVFIMDMEKQEVTNADDVKFCLDQYKRENKDSINAALAYFGRVV